MKAAENRHSLHDFSSYDCSIATAGKEDNAPWPEAAFSATNPYISPLAQTPDGCLILAYLQSDSQNLNHHEDEENSKEEFQFHGINRRGRRRPTGQIPQAGAESDRQSCGSHLYPGFPR